MCEQYQRKNSTSLFHKQAFITNSLASKVHLGKLNFKVRDFSGKQHWALFQKIDIYLSPRITQFVFTMNAFSSNSKLFVSETILLFIFIFIFCSSTSIHQVLNRNMLSVD